MRHEREKVALVEMRTAVMTEAGLFEQRQASYARLWLILSLCACLFLFFRSVSILFASWQKVSWLADDPLRVFLLLKVMQALIGLLAQQPWHRPCMSFQEES